MKKRKWLRNILAVLMCAALLCACTPQTPSNSTEGVQAVQKLSELKEGELLAALRRWNVSVPANVELVTVRLMLKELEEDPDHTAPVVSYTVIADLYEALRTMVKEYYNASE